jgi:regulator of sirC expression with transglutaminase-like and TPR domain
VCDEGVARFVRENAPLCLPACCTVRWGLFVGDADSYDAPANADFIRVLERRLGLPIALSILYVAIARRAGWSSYVLNLPGQVLVQIGEKSPVVIDPFAGGGLVSHGRLRRSAGLALARKAALPHSTSFG